MLTHDDSAGAVSITLSSSFDQYCSRCSTRSCRLLFSQHIPLRRLMNRAIDQAQQLRKSYSTNSSSIRITVVVLPTQGCRGGSAFLDQWFHVASLSIKHSSHGEISENNGNAVRNWKKRSFDIQIFFRCLILAFGALLRNLPAIYHLVFSREAIGTFFLPAGVSLLEEERRLCALFFLSLRARFDSSQLRQCFSSSDRGRSSWSLFSLIRVFLHSARPTNSSEVIVYLAFKALENMRESVVQFSFVSKYLRRILRIFRYSSCAKAMTRTIH